jgi:flagellar basal-body rod modification protein FlgD
MPISTTSVSSTAPAQSGNIGIQDFLKILTSQLNNQDPLKPVDNQEFVAQIAQFASLEQSRQLNVKLDQMLASQSATQSIGILGKTVEAQKDGVLWTGKVTALSLDSGQPLLTITANNAAGTVVPGFTLAQVINIR